MKKDNVPLIVAIFLVMGGFFSGIILGNKTLGMQVSPIRQGNGLFIATARGAEGATMLLGARIPSSITAVSDNSELNTKLVFSSALGAVRDISALGSVQSSSRSR
jgi:hypothetical protein